jgi:transcriptional regulator with XRE-family HTH domain
MVRRIADGHDRAKGRKLARLRKASGLPQERLATRLGISPKQLGKYERGQNRIPAGRYEGALRCGYEMNRIADAEANEQGTPGERSVRNRKFHKQCIGGATIAKIALLYIMTCFASLWPLYRHEP